jgi:uncharacterized membrane protein HdeD (DUF308 family)
MTTPPDAGPCDAPAPATELVRRTWWTFVLGGVASIAFGVLALLAPATALFVISVFFAASVLVDGAAALSGAFQHRDKDGWRVMALLGVLGVLVGGYALLVPPAAVAAFVAVVAFQAILLGVLTAMLGWRVRRVAEGEWILYLTGALSVGFGLMVLAEPAAGSFSVVAIVAFWAIVTGVMRTVFGLKLKTQPPSWNGEPAPRG